MFRHRVTQFYELRRNYKSFSDVVLLQHRKVRRLDRPTLSSSQIHHPSQQAEIPVNRRVLCSFSLTLLNEVVEQVRGDCPDQTVLEKRIEMFEAPNVAIAILFFFHPFYPPRPVIHDQGLADV